MPYADPKCEFYCPLRHFAEKQCAFECEARVTLTGGPSLDEIVDVLPNRFIVRGVADVSSKMGKDDPVYGRPEDRESLERSMNLDDLRDEIAKLRIDSIPEGGGKQASRAAYSWNLAISAVLVRIDQARLPTLSDEEIASQVGTLFFADHEAPFTKGAKWARTRLSPRFGEAMPSADLEKT